MPTPSRTSLAADFGQTGPKPGSSRRWILLFTSSPALDATTKFFRRQLWAWPTIAALVIGGAGWGVNTAVESTLREQRADAMTTILRADVEALRGWVKREEQVASQIADTSEVRAAARQLNTPALGQSSDPKAVEALRRWFAPRLKDYGFRGFFLISADAVVVAAEEDQPQGKALTGYRKEFFASVLEGRARVSRPYKALTWMKDDDGVLRMGVPTMFAAAPVRDESGKVIAALGLRINPGADFTRILQTAQAGKTGETYAFDRDGLMLSQSRFDEEMKEYGLLVDRPEERSILNLHLKNPGANLSLGERAPSRRANWPLTKPVSDSIERGDGFDVDGYPDYRGVPKLGAWTWLPEYDMGVVTEVNRDEAFRPVYILRLALGVLLGLLLLAAVGLFAAMWVLNRQQQKLRAAVLEAKQLGQYTLVEKIGQGGMGTVYRAKHAMLRRPTAVKLLDITKMTDLAVVRFEREVQMTSALTHPNTVAVFDFGRTPEGVFYYAMEYLDGINLEELVKRSGRLPQERVVYLLKQACGSLAEAHAAGLVHRDVKPANIFITCRGGLHDFVKVLDFGLVKSSTGDANDPSANAPAGTPLYMPPEAFTRPDTVGPPADVYALGAVAYFLLVGEPVFTAKSTGELCMKHINEEPLSPTARGVSVSPELEVLLLACLAKSPAARPQSAADLLAALEDSPTARTWSATLAATWWANTPQSKGDGEPASTQVVASPAVANSDLTQMFVSSQLKQ